MNDRCPVCGAILIVSAHRPDRRGVHRAVERRERCPNDLPCGRHFERVYEWEVTTVIVGGACWEWPCWQDQADAACREAAIGAAIGVARGAWRGDHPVLERSMECIKN